MGGGGWSASAGLVLLWNFFSFFSFPFFLVSCWGPVGLGIEFSVFVVGWRHAYWLGEWHFSNIIWVSFDVVVGLVLLLIYMQFNHQLHQFECGTLFMYTVVPLLL